MKLLPQLTEPALQTSFFAVAVGSTIMRSTLAVLVVPLGLVGGS
jgi:hypothetical protein